MTSWEPVWKSQTEQHGVLHRLGKKLAARGDLQRLVIDTLKKRFPISEETRILEVGCGSGPVAGVLLDTSPHVYGVDIAPSAVALTRQSGVLASVADSRELPFKKDVFNLVYSTGMVDLFRDVEAALILKEMSRVTSSGGRMVVITAWSGCRLHETIKNYLIKKERWRYGSKRTFSTLEGLVPDDVLLIDERSIGALFQFRFVSYLFEGSSFLRRIYHFCYLLISIVFRFLNNFPGALLVSVLEKK